MSEEPGAARPEGSIYASVTVPSRVESIRPAAEFIVQTARNMRVAAASEPLFEVAVVEALNNAVKHGNAEQRADALILCEMELGDHGLTLRVLGQGQEFILPRTPQPDWSVDDVTAIPEGGFGIPIIRSVFPTVRVVARPGQYGIEMALTF